MTDPDVIARLDTLEVRVAQQDVVIEDLNATITAQWSKIDGLLRQVNALGDRVREAESRAVSAAPVQPPPHY